MSRRSSLALADNIYTQETKAWGLSVIREFMQDLDSQEQVALKTNIIYKKIEECPLTFIEETVESIIDMYSDESGDIPEQYNELKLEFLFLLLKFKHSLHPLSQQSQQLMKRLDSVNRTPQRMPSTFLKRSPLRDDTHFEGKNIDTPPSSPKKLVNFGSPSKGLHPLCRICECEIAKENFKLHIENCLLCHSMKLEWDQLNEKLLNEINEIPSGHCRELLKQAIDNTLFTSMVSRYLSDNLIQLVKDGKEKMPPLIFEDFQRRHSLMKKGAEAAEIASSTIISNDAPNLTEGYAMPPLTPPRLSDFEIVAPISRGAYGSVYICTRKQTGDIFALKAIPVSDIAMKNEVLDTEREVMCRALHPSTISLYWSFRASAVFFVMSFARGGDLFALLESVGCLEEDVATFYVAELILAVEYLHSLNVVHCDLKPDNILISDSGHLQLTDFGLSKFGAEQREVGRSLMFRFSRQKASAATHESEKRVVGTPNYISPESLLRSDYSPKADWWAVGCIAYELVVGQPPFIGDNEQQVFSRIVAGKFGWPDDIEVSDDYKRFVTSLLQAQPEKRPGSAELKAMPIFEGIDWDHLYESEAPFVPEFTDGFDLSYFENARNAGEVDDIEELKAVATRRDKPDEWCCTNIAALAEKNREILATL